MTDHSDSVSADEAGLSRRDVFQAVAAGAAASTAIGSSAFAQQAPATLVSSADYVRDPNRWGTPEVAALFPGFQHVENGELRDRGLFDGDVRREGCLGLGLDLLCGRRGWHAHRKRRLHA